jgi:hypothetical protein
MPRLIVVLCSLFALMLGPAHAQSVQRIDVTEFGIYTAGTKQIYHAPQSTTGIAQRVSASSIDRVTLKRMIHVPEPGVHNPETGNTVLTSVVMADTRIGTMEIAGYQCGHDWEIVPGTWTIDLWDGDRKLASQSFQLVRE